jgi:hypothetical protein
MTKRPPFLQKNDDRFTQQTYDLPTLIMTFIAIDSGQSPEIDFTEEEFQTMCLEKTGNTCLHWLKAWCNEQGIQKSTWRRLYFNLLAHIKTDGMYETTPDVYCCIQEQINDLRERSIKVCDKLGWELDEIDNSFEVQAANGAIVGIVTPTIDNGYVSKHIRQPGVGDEYTAALSFADPNAIADILRAIDIQHLEASLRD